MEYADFQHVLVHLCTYEKTVDAVGDMDETYGKTGRMKRLSRGGVVLWTMNGNETGVKRLMRILETANDVKSTIL